MTNEESIAYANDWLKDEYALCEDDKEVLRMAIEALQAKTDGDLISRQALCEYALNQKDKAVTPNDIMRFPSAPDSRQRGEWKAEIGYDGEVIYYECSHCGNAFTLIDGTPEDNNYNFCPNCGADMRGEEE